MADNITGDPLWDSVTSLLYFDEANGSTSIQDHARGTNWTGLSGAQASNGSSLFGDNVGWTDGVAALFRSPTDSAYIIGTQDFTLECWIRPNNGGAGKAYGRLFLLGDNGSLGSLYVVRRNDPNPLETLVQEFKSGGYANVITTRQGTITFPNDVWAHYALCREGSEYREYHNGELIGSGDTTTAFNLTFNRWRIGANNIGTEEYRGYFSNFRITQGHARYRAAFTPPADKFPTYSAIKTTSIQSATVTVNAQVTFTTTTSGGVGPYTHAWFDDLGNPVPGETSNSLTVSNLQLSNSGDGYYCEASDTVGQLITTNTAYITVVEEAGPQPPTDINEITSVRGRAIHYPYWFPCPTWQYSQSESAYQRRTHMESGWYRQRKEFPEYGSSVNLQWVMNTLEFFQWSDWMEANGHDWFVMPLDDYGEGKQEYELRLSTDITFEYDDSDVVTCSATGELGSPLFGRGSQIPPAEQDCVPAYIIRAPECVITESPYACDAWEQGFFEYKDSPEFGCWPFLDPTDTGTIPQYFARSNWAPGAGPELTSDRTGTGWNENTLWDQALGSGDADVCKQAPKCIANRSTSTSIHFENHDSGIWGLNVPSQALCFVVHDNYGGVAISSVKDGFAYNESGNTTSADASGLYVYFDWTFQTYRVTYLGRELTGAFGNPERNAPYMVIVKAYANNDRYEHVPGYSRTSFGWYCDGQITFKIVGSDGTIRISRNDTFFNQQIGQTFLAFKDDTASIEDYPERKIQATTNDTAAILGADNLGIYQVAHAGNFGNMGQTGVMQTTGAVEFPSDEDLIQNWLYNFNPV